MTVPLDRHYLVELQVSAERVSQLRRIVAAHLRHWSLDLHVRPVCRALEELLTNVHRHVGGDNECVIELRWTGRHLTVAVADNGAGMPRLLAMRRRTEPGHGAQRQLGHLPDRRRQSRLVHPLRRGAARDRPAAPYAPDGAPESHPLPPRSSPDRAPATPARPIRIVCLRRA